MVLREQAHRVRLGTFLSLLTCLHSAAYCETMLKTARPDSSTGEKGILFAVLQSQVKPQDRKVCLGLPLQGPGPDYLERLTRDLPYSDQNDRDAYSREARRLLKIRRVPLASNQVIGLDDLRSQYPAARTVNGSQCMSLLVVHRPVFVDNWAFLEVSEATPCRGLTSRLALVRQQGRWLVKHTHLEASTGGPARCADRPWDAPSGVPLRRVLITN